MLKFNDKKMPDFMKVKSIKIQSLPVVELNMKKIVGSSGRIAGRTSLGEKIIECEILVVIPEGKSLQECGRELAVWLRGDDFRLSPLVIEDDPGVRYMATVNNSAELSDLIFVGSGSIQFIIPSGEAEAIEETVVSGGNRIEVNNKGTKSVFPVITGEVGATVSDGSLVFQNVTTGKKVVLNGTFSVGSIITIDCNKHLVKIGENLNLKVINLESEFFEIKEGLNVLQCLNGDVSLSVKFRNKFL